MDVLSDILDLLQLRGSLYFRTAFSPPWSVAVPALERAARFHLAVQGRCSVRIGTEREVQLNPGDLIVIPGGTPQPDADTKLVCGHFAFAEGADHPLLRALPSHLLVTAELRARSPWLDELIRLIAGQMFAEVPGMKASVIRLSEALFIEVIRSCADQDESLRKVVAAVGDPRIGRALALMHRRFDRDWTLEAIAREVGMSRSRFAEQFQGMMNCAPMSYLSDLRLHQARTLLAGSGEPIQAIAQRVGYQSPAAFSRAFSNRYGHSPKAARQASA